MGKGCGPHGSRATAEGGLEGVSGRDSWGRGGTLKTLCMLGRKGLGFSMTCGARSGGILGGTEPGSGVGGDTRRCAWVLGVEGWEYISEDIKFLVLLELTF